MLWLCKISNLGGHLAEIRNDPAVREVLAVSQVHSLTISALNSVLISWLLPICPWGNKNVWPTLSRSTLYQRHLIYKVIMYCLCCNKLLCFARNGEKNTTETHWQGIVNLSYIFKRYFLNINHIRTPQKVSHHYMEVYCMLCMKCAVKINSIWGSSSSDEHAKEASIHNILFKHIRPHPHITCICFISISYCKDSFQP